MVKHTHNLSQSQTVQENEQSGNGGSAHGVDGEIKSSILAFR